MLFLQLKILKPNKSLKKFSQNYISGHRYKTSLKLWDEEVDTNTKLKIEKHWAAEVTQNQNKNLGKPYYVLPMFPYPSGNLHMGHVRVYSISDTIARFQKLNGKNPVHPIGWDAFGLPAENAAIERNIQAPEWTKSNIESMKNQLQQLCFNFDWDREISTCDPKYYKWTQYIFLKLFENGLAYQSKAQVNWDPVDKTVLADEQVDDLSCSWRSGAKVEKKYLTQWFIKTTKYAKKLYDGLNSEHLDNWKDIINLQKHWIGECDGVVVTFKMLINNTTKEFAVWTSEPYKFIHGNFLIMSSSHVLLQDLQDKSKLVLTCKNPITETDMPVYISDNVNYPIGKDVLIACPKANVDDLKISFSLNIPRVENDIIINTVAENKRAIDIANSKNVGGYFVSSKLKDWLISRQRYWGTPIPIIHCPKCGNVPVPYEDLPVRLPEIKTQYSSQTLQNLDDWVNCKCPNCQSISKRETDTMDTFVDSSWYFYRFLDPNNKDMPFDKEKIRNHVPVHIYIGGKEHAVLHLYYARFMSYFLHSLGWTDCEEPFKKLIVQGMVMGQSYKVKSSGKYIPAQNVEKVGKDFKEIGTGESVLVQWEKMSKSKYNGENPERLLSAYGCDTTRLLILADVPPTTTRRWSDDTLPGVLNWQRRLWYTMRDFLEHRKSASDKSTLNNVKFQEYERKIWDSRNYFIATTTYHFKYSHMISVGISRLQSLTNTLRNNVPPEVIAKSKEFELALGALIIMLSPITPHFCSELWAGLLSANNRLCVNSKSIDWQKNVLEQTWPLVDENYGLSFLCKVDGADKCNIQMTSSELLHLNADKALQIMLEQESVQKSIKRGILRNRFELYPDCRAILNIFTNRNKVST